MPTFSRHFFIATWSRWLNSTNGLTCEDLSQGGLRSRIYASSVMKPTQPIVNRKTESHGVRSSLLPLLPYRTQLRSMGFTATERRSASNVCPRIRQSLSPGGTWVHRSLPFVVRGSQRPVRRRPSESVGRLVTRPSSQPPRHLVISSQSI